MSLPIQAPIRGAQFRPAAAREIIASLKTGEEVQLAREPHNEYDENAIAVLYNDHHIGYVGKEMAVLVAPIMDERQEMVATVQYFHTSIQPVIEINLASSENDDDGPLAA